MIDSLRHLLETTPALALFLVIGLGYAVGRISIFGFSIGAGAVLFVGLACGIFAPNAAPPGLVGTLGLLMFLYGIGVQYGPQFFAGLRGAGVRQNSIALFAVLVALGVVIWGGSWIGISVAQSAGVFAGAMTSTAALQAALEAAGNRDPAVGYSIAYPFGVVGPMLCLYIATKVAKPVFPAPPPSVAVSEITIDREQLPIEDLFTAIPPGATLMAVRLDHHNQLPAPGLVLKRGDGVLVAGLQVAVDATRQAIGHLESGRLSKDRNDLDGRLLFVSNASIVGVPLGELAPRARFPLHLAYVLRGESVVIPNPHVTLEFGDRVMVMAAPERHGDLRRIFGDSITATAEFSYIALGAGIVLGVLLGLLPVPLPFIGKFSLGLAGGPLVMALVLGKLGRTGTIGWRLPISANLVMRNFGLTLFLAAVGMASGTPFVTQVAANGAPLLVLGALAVLLVVVIVFIIGRWLLKMPFEEVLGIAAGATGNPAILVFVNQLVPSDKPNVGYAMIFPSMTIVKIIAVQMVLRLIH